MFGGFGNNKSSYPIGLDLGMHSVKMLQFGSDGEGSQSDRIVARAWQALPADLSEDDPQRSQLYISAIRDMLANQPFVERRVVSCLPATALQYKILRMPKMPACDLAAAVQFEAVERLELNADEMALQFFDAGEVRQGEDVRHEVIAMAASQAAVQQHIDILKACGLHPTAIDAVPGALGRYLSRRDAPDAQDPPVQVVLDVGFASSKVVVARGGRVLFFKLIDIGGRHLDEMVARRLSMSVVEATELRQRLRQSDLTADDGDESLKSDAARHENVERAVFEAMRYVVDELSTELQLCLRYYSVTFRGRRPDQVWLVGGEAYSTKLASILADSADLTVRPADLLKDVSDDGSSCDGMWAVAAGLSMHRVAQTRRLSLKRGATKRGAA